MRYFIDKCKNINILFEDDTFKVEISGNCVISGEFFSVKVLQSAYIEYITHGNFNSAFAEISKEEREFLISGIAPKSWNFTETPEKDEDNLVFITLANSNKIIFNSDIKNLNLSGEIYKIPIFFFSKYEKNALLAIQELLKDPEKYFNEIYVPYVPVDTFKYVYAEQFPAYHKKIDCHRLNSDFENFIIPEEIKERGMKAVVEFRSWFEEEKHLIERPDLFVIKLQSRWGIITNPKAITRINSGITQKEKITINELEINIDTLIQEAGNFYYLSVKNQTILKKFAQYSYLAYRETPLNNNNTNFPDFEVKELLREYDERFKKPLKAMLIEYYRIKHNPNLSMQGEILSKLGFRACSSCFT